MIIEAFKKIAKLNSKHNSIIHKMWKTDKEYNTPRKLNNFL